LLGLVAQALARQLREGVSEEQLTAWLSDARTGALGLPAAPEQDHAVALLIHWWYAGAGRRHEI
jgi:hypothetical protein